MKERTVFETRVVTGEGGGPEKTILNTPRFMESRGYPSVCVYLRPRNDAGFHAIEERARQWNAPLEAIDDGGPLDFSVLKKLGELCDQRRPTIWHGHDYKTNFFGLFVARKRPITLVTTLHGWVKRTWKTPLYYAIDRRCIRRYAAVIAVSQDLFDAALNFGTPRERCFLVPNAIDTDEFRRSLPTEAAKKARGVSTNRLLIGAVGRLSHEKGFDLLVEALARLVAEGIDLELQIAGDGDERGRLQRLIDDFGLADRIKLIGFQSDLAHFYQSLDVFVLSSRREGLPNVLLEAMAYEVPVLATRIAGVPGLIDHERTGLLVDPEDKVAISAGLRRLIADHGLRRRCAQNARRLIETDYSFDRRMDRIKEIYDLTLDREGRS